MNTWTEIAHPVGWTNKAGKKQQTKIGEKKWKKFKIPEFSSVSK